jgi:hypothetical protein
MVVEIFTICDAATISGGKLNILGSFDRLNAQSFPCRLSECAVAVKMRFEHTERGQRLVEIQFVDVAGNKIISQEIRVLVAPPEDRRHLQLHYTQFYNVQLNQPGEYHVELVVDGKKRARIPLFVVLVPWRTPLYRFPSRQNALKLVNDGNLRLNPPSFLHDETRLGSYVGDSREGNQTITVTDTPVVAGADLPKQLRNFAPFPKPDDPIPITCVIVEAELKSRCGDTLIYSLTTRMAAENVVGVNGDTWVVIDNPSLFFAAVNRVLPEDLEFRGLYPCTYVSEKLNYREPAAKLHPIVLKDQRYSHQEEVRAVWTSKSHVQRAEPLSITSAQIPKYCRIISAPPATAISTEKNKKASDPNL